MPWTAGKDYSLVKPAKSDAPHFNKETNMPSFEPDGPSYAELQQIRAEQKGLTGDFTQPIPPHTFNRECEYLKTDKGCYYCCDACNYDKHTCYGCGDELSHLGKEWASGKPHGDCTS